MSDSASFGIVVGWTLVSMCVAVLVLDMSSPTLLDSQVKRFMVQIKDIVLTSHGVWCVL